MTERPVGVIEGFYGTPWGWDARAEVAAWCAERGMTDFVYAPKDDRKQREAWREPYDDVELAGFEGFAREGALSLGFTISPGLSMDYADRDDRATLAMKVDQLLDVGATYVVLAFDDIPFGGREQGEAHAELTTWLQAHIGDRARMSLVPTEYVGALRSPYLDALDQGLPQDVPIGWTGQAVVNDVITVADAEQRAAVLGGRRPLLWDNYPVNDGPMADRLYLGPLRGREAGLVDACIGYCANPMVQPLAPCLPLASICGWLRGEDPEAVWEREAADLGLLAFAHVCDGELAESIVASGDRAEIRRYFAEAAVCAAPGLEGEAEPWVVQAQRDAKLALQALDVLEGDHLMEQVLALAVRWQRSRRSEVSVFGPRLSVRPGFGQRPDGTWLVLQEAVQRDRNAVDASVGQALDTLA